MKFNYYQDTDSLYIELSANPSTDSRVIADGLVIDFDKNGQVVGFDIDSASKIANLAKFEIEGFGIQAQL